MATLQELQVNNFLDILKSPIFDNITIPISNLAAISPNLQRAAQQGLLLGFCCFDETEISTNMDVLSDIIESRAREPGNSVG